MAVDTRSKRASMLQFGRPWVCLLPFPDGTIDQGDRQHFLRLYSGILAEELIAGVEIVEGFSPITLSIAGNSLAILILEADSEVTQALEGKSLV